MKRCVLIAALAAAAILVVVPAASPASGKDYKGPACANITSGDGGYNGTTGGTATVDFVVQYAAPLCSGISYSFFVTSTTGESLGIATSGGDCTPEVAGGGCLHFTATVNSAPDTVCVYATTAHKNGNQTDYAPDTDPGTVCMTPTPERSLTINTPPGIGGFR